MDTESLFAAHIYLEELRRRYKVCNDKDRGGIMKLIVFYENVILKSAKETYQQVKDDVDNS